MNAAELRRQGIISGIGFFVAFVAVFPANLLGPGWPLGFGIAAALLFLWYGFSTVATRVVAARESARGYTTMKSMAGRYRYVDPKTIKHGLVPDSGADPARFQPQLVDLRPIHGPAGSSTANPRSGHGRALVLSVAAVLVLCGVALGKVASLAVQDPSGLPVVGLVLLGGLTLCAGIVLVPGSVSSWLALRRVRRLDPGTLFLVSSSFVMRKTITTLYPGSFVSGLLILAIDDQGIRFWSSKLANGEPMLRISWPAVNDVGYVDAATIGSGLGDRIVIRARLKDDKLCDLPFQPLQYTEVVAAPRARRAQIAALLSTTRETTSRATS